MAGLVIAAGRGEAGGVAGFGLPKSDEINFLIINTSETATLRETPAIAISQMPPHRAAPAPQRGARRLEKTRPATRLPASPKILPRRVHRPYEMSYMLRQTRHARRHPHPRHQRMPYPTTNT